MPLSLISRFRETVLVCGKFIGITVMFVSLKTCATCQSLTMKPLDAAEIIIRIRNLLYL